jgi:ComF family protein
MPAPILCAPCRAHVSNLVNLRSVGYYATPLREAIHALKYSGVRALAEPLSALLADCLKVWSPPIEVIVPVPLHRSRVRYRGYNQASLLAQALGQRVCLPVCGDCLERQRATRSQVGLTAPERHSNVAGAFACTTNSLHGTRVLLVDDVFTTGATLEASAQALLAAGALGVWALTLARAADPA